LERVLIQSLHLGRPGESGETYAFDAHGRMISESRFLSDLRRAGVLSEQELATGSLFVTDPGSDVLKDSTSPVPHESRELTRMAASATAGITSMDVSGYRDYRGRSVLGAWIWDEELNLGLTSEIDEAEVLDEPRPRRERAPALAAPLTRLRPVRAPVYQPRHLAR
jgi:hypothetical protein